MIEMKEGHRAIVRELLRGLDDGPDPGRPRRDRDLPHRRPRGPVAGATRARRRPSPEPRAGDLRRGRHGGHRALTRPLSAYPACPCSPCFARRSAHGRRSRCASGSGAGWRSTAAREFPWAFGALGVLAIALLVAPRRPRSAFGVVVIALLALGVLVAARFARQSLSSARGDPRGARRDRARPDDDGARLPAQPRALSAADAAGRAACGTGAGSSSRATAGERCASTSTSRPSRAAKPSRCARRSSRSTAAAGSSAAASSRASRCSTTSPAHGWVGFNIDYRLSPRATFPDHVVDVKRAIAWVREHAAEYGADPDFICITGGSAGGHLCALAALTADDPSLQPGFEDADTSVAAAVPFYGVYDLTNAEGDYYPELRRVGARALRVQGQARPTSPERFRARVADLPRAPPTRRRSCVLHGDRDTLVPVGDARRFVREPARGRPTARCSTPSSPAPSTPSTSCRGPHGAGGRDDRALPGDAVHEPQTAGLSRALEAIG